MVLNERTFGDGSTKMVVVRNVGPSAHEAHDLCSFKLKHVVALLKIRTGGLEALLRFNVVVFDIPRQGSRLWWRLLDIYETARLWGQRERRSLQLGA